MIFLGTFDYLTDMLVFIMWIFSIMMFVGVFILRKREPKLERPYKISLYPLPPIIAIIGGSYIVINTIIFQPILAILGILITLIGLPLYYIHEYHKRKTD